MHPEVKRRLQQQCLFLALLGLCSLAAGVKLSSGPNVSASFLLVISGTWLAAVYGSRWIQLNGVRAAGARQQHQEFRRRFRRSTLPRQVFQVLIAVAEVDGHADARELELVRRFLLDRFVDPISTAELREWSLDGVDPSHAGPIAAELRRVLSDAECETIFYWACLVAFADRTFRPGEHEVLQDISVGLGLEGPHARRIFHYAKARFVAGEGLGSDSGQPPRDHRADGSTRSDPHSRAFAVLGLEPGTNADTLKKRFRELTKKYHPDAHAHLGPVAAEEASTRFKEIKEAYEFLNAAAKR